MAERGAAWHRLTEVGSTQDEAWRRMEALNEAGALVVAAERQTGGRGQWGRRWSSPVGGAWLSVGVRGLAADGLMALRAAEALRDVLAAWCPVPAAWSIKPPNDLLIHGRKVAGVLVEHRPQLGVVVGIGVNVCNPSAALRSAAEAAGEPLRRPAISLVEAGCGASVEAVSEAAAVAVLTMLQPAE